MVKRRPAPARRSLKPTGKLADYAAAKATDTVLLGDIQKHVLAKASAPSDRRQDIIHPSEMAKADWCPRSTWYRLKGTEPSDSGRDFSMQMETIFQEGHDAHNKWQGWMWEMGHLWGRWKCLECEFVFTATSPMGCPDCSSGNLQYAEVHLDAEESHLIVGHEDGAVGDALVEIKTIGLGTVRMEEPDLVRKNTVKTEDGKSVVDYDALWKNLRRPLGAHIRQTQIYLHIANLMGLEFKRVVFLYENKANQAVKEFSMDYKPDTVAHLFETALDIKYALKSGTEIARPKDNGPLSKVCKECPFRSLCWKDESAQSEEGRGHDDAGDSVKPRSRHAARAGAAAAPATRRERAEAAGGSDRTRRLRPDAAVRIPGPVDGVHGGPTRSSGGGRKVARRRSVPAQGAG